MNPALAVEIDRDILSYVREMQRLGPVTSEPVERFLRVVRRREIASDDVADRLAYLTDKNLLKKRVEWSGGGQMEIYAVTADGMDVLDGNLPPPQWRPRP
jgi:hypothetical protein